MWPSYFLRDLEANDVSVEVFSTVQIPHIYGQVTYLPWSIAHRVFLALHRLDYGTFDL